MKNPWEEISLSDYENHMSLDSVRQLQSMNSIMRDQFEDYPVDSAAVLGIAGGNGLEHVRREKYRRIYGVDINADYLKTVSERYANLDGILQCMRLDIIDETEKLPQAGLVIANILIEYVGCPAFQRAIRQINPAYVSCVIQINADEGAWVSDSPYLHSFDALDEIHHRMDENMLIRAMSDIGYRKILHKSEPLPNGKRLVRMDFKRE